MSSEQHLLKGTSATLKKKFLGRPLLGLNTIAQGSKVKMVVSSLNLKEFSRSGNGHLGAVQLCFQLGL